MKSQKSKIKNIFLVSFLALILLCLVGYGTVRAYAGEPGKYPPVIKKLVERFGLNEEEVKAVFDEERTEHQEQGQAHFEERLNQAVSDGKMTPEQKEAILAKKKEMRNNDEEFKNLSAEERQEKMKVHQEEMKKWAEEQGIDLSLLPMFLGKGPRGGFGRPALDQ
jgi:hypothetical protein